MIEVPAAGARANKFSIRLFTGRSTHTISEITKKVTCKFSIVQPGVPCLRSWVAKGRANEKRLRSCVLSTFMSKNSRSLAIYSYPWVNWPQASQIMHPASIFWKTSALCGKNKYDLKKVTDTLPSFNSVFVSIAQLACHPPQLLASWRLSGRCAICVSLSSLKVWNVTPDPKE